MSPYSQQNCNFVEIHLHIYYVVLLLCCSVIICVVLCIVCTVPLLPGVNPIAVDKYINISIHTVLVLRRFCWNAFCQFTSLLNLRAPVFSLTPFGRMRSFTPSFSWRRRWREKRVAYIFIWKFHDSHLIYGHTLLRDYNFERSWHFMQWLRKPCKIVASGVELLPEQRFRLDNFQIQVSTAKVTK